MLHLTALRARPATIRPLTFERLFASRSPVPPTSRLSKIESRLPNFLRRYTIPLRNAPVSHITAFLLLHELTAVVPLLGLTAFFHYTNWLPPYISEGKWMADYTAKFGNYMRKKGWISENSGGDRWWGRGEKGTRIVVEVATAYAVTKVLLPLRLVFSVWGTPWFARLAVLPIAGWVGNMGRRVLGKQPVPVIGRGNDAAGTGAVGGGVGPRDGL